MLNGSCHCGTVTWRFDRIPDDATVCNCTVCRRYGVIWAYDYEGEAIHVSGPNEVYTRSDDAVLGFHFCGDCGCVAYWRASRAGDDGRRRIAVNLRLADDPDAVADIVIEHFDGFDQFKDTGTDGRCVKDYWT